RGPVEGQPVLERGDVERLRGDGEVLHDARQVTEPDVDEPDLLVGDEAQDLVGTGEHAGVLLHSSVRSGADGRAVSAVRSEAMSGVLPDRHPCVAQRLTSPPRPDRSTTGRGTGTPFYS